MSDNNLVLSLHNVGVNYRRQRGVWGEAFWALRDISFDLYQGDTLGIIGRNGAGKSTLLRLIAGIIQPDKGKIIYDTSHQIGLLSLQLGFVPYLTGRENAILSGILLGLRKKEIKARMNSIIEFSELGNFIDQPIATYSSGMLARLGFAVAFQADPDVLLIDEILGVGDAEFHQKSTRMMQEKIRSHKAIVFVSHNSQLVQQLCNRVVWVEEGVTRMQGNTAEVLQAYHRFLHLGE
ncbi:ABC-type polysaccharide/polyol phosphate transport system, ATPase component [Beggiatoa alba B18LD]|uniref:ABC-type polysaccharide/polyol phosphate transport system, ATPase component n=1 Tax=Beggiatoa alba B18LD TaxID=395493 RepID=I3CJ59_9GAMM|nr:ABC transporter ATP-binding protein [Beggiatoa alba]EIJ43652.1 ABC-type polysaccharide/polyol phosphate transport system, ATPase component [Beggiatoa alba B18LD]